MTNPPDGERRVLACPLYHGGKPASIAGTADWRHIDELLGDDPFQTGVVIVDASMLGHVERLRRLPRGVVMVAADRDAAVALGARSPISVAGVADPAAMFGVLEAACALAIARRRSAQRWACLSKSNAELHELLDIGMGLMTEHDRPALLRRIVNAGKRFTRSDGCGIALTETNYGKEPRLRLKLYEFDSIPDLPPLEGPIDNSTIIGHAAMTGKVLVVDDAYQLPSDVDFKSSKEFDETYGYYRRSMLVVPMIDQIGNIVGVLVCVNRKTDPNAKIRTKEDADRYVTSYTSRDVRLARSLAGEAAVAVENVNLYAQIERTLESFVKASVSAIDQRDPTTSGHSIRVAALTTALASAVERSHRGAYRDVHFTTRQMRELRFAALLHDFGKVTVRDDVLMKAKKLPPLLWERVQGRFDLIHRTIELEDCLRRGGQPSNGGPTLAEQLDELADVRRVVAQANEPSFTGKAPSPKLLEIARRTFTLPDGTTAPYLTGDELHFLQITSGTLDAGERAEIESHVSQTYEYLIRIPWTEDLKNLAPYAYGHHEKLTGSGYPRGLHGSEIPIQTRMITVADMFDALTAADRPYKPAVSVEKAMDILQSEAKAGKLDADLVAVMADSKACRRVIDSDWHQL
jgi:HD-GYP domain-containing protein (c-di-GMP phosphodiesterase class II)